MIKTLFLAAVVGAVLTQAEVKFPAHLSAKIGGRTVRISDTKMNYFEAAFECKKANMNFFLPQNKAEEQQLHNFLNLKNLFRAWIGANRYLQDETAKKFIVHETGQPIPKLWAPGEPNNYNGTEECVEIVREGFNDYFCSFKKLFICEAK